MRERMALLTTTERLDLNRHIGTELRGVELLTLDVRWEPHTMTLWDNRVVWHHASRDYFPETRSGWRVTTRGERPYLATEA
jgi:alpha-ketoglutarate-dependent taurine dioxygenase